MKRTDKCNKIVFLSYGIGGVGGGQNYLKNRCELYKNQGYKVYLIYTLFDPKYLKHSFDAVCRIQAVGQPINNFSKRYIGSIINVIKKVISFQDSDNIIFESNNKHMAFWAELVAQDCGSKHFCYILGEDDVITSELENLFFKFKLDRRELAGIHVESIRKLFARYRKINNSEAYYVRATAQTYMNDNIVQELECLPPCDYTIGILSRLEKPFVIPTLRDFLEFCRAHKDKIVNLIIVGEGNKSIIYKIKQLYKDDCNVNLIFTGSLEPLPSLYPKLCDVCIGTSGCAYITHSYGRITISIDGADFKPIGILGYTTENRLFRSSEPVVELKVLLEQILIEQKYPKNHPQITQVSTREESHMIHHNYIMDSSSSKEYYDLSKTLRQKNTVPGRIFILKRLIENLIGTNIYYKLFAK